MIIGALMIEHRLIERMVKILDQELEKAGKDGLINPSDLDSFVEFMRVYADQCHHGKEEGILFAELGRKDVSREHRKIILELVSDHIFGRSQVDKLVSLNAEYKAGDKGKLKEITAVFSGLAAFYAAHIRKEDKDFFIPVMRYFSPDEHQAMLKASNEFDSKIDLAKYQKMVVSLENNLKS